MNKEDRGFYWQSRSEYWDSLPRASEINDEVLFGLYPDGGTQGTCGEMSVIWKELAGEIVPRLLVFEDAWKALSGFGDLLKEMARVDSKRITAEIFVQILVKCGFRDLTEYGVPKARISIPPTESGCLIESEEVNLSESSLPMAAAQLSIYNPVDLQNSQDKEFSGLVTKARTYLNALFDRANAEIAKTEDRRGQPGE